MTTTTETIRAKFDATRRELNAALIEREQEIECCLAAIVAREHVLLVGPAGTAKSLLASTLVEWLSGRQFYVLLNKFSTIEEVFGPISLRGLKEERYARVTRNRLPTADIAFVDEIFKASSAILNSLLTILNERQYDNDGERQRCPLQLCISASNEWSGGVDGGGKETAALFDRFLLRRPVRPVQSARGQERLLWDAKVGRAELSTRITREEIDAAAADAAAMPWTEEAKGAMRQILSALRAEGIQPGDRRRRKSVGVAQAAAWVNGNSAVHPEDLEILGDVLWVDPAEQPAICARIVAQIANPAGARVSQLQAEADEIMSGTDPRELDQFAVACKKLGNIAKELKGLKGSRAALVASYVEGEVKALRLATVDAL